MPKSNRTLLLVEDEQDQIGMWRRELEEYNRKVAAPVSFRMLEARSRTAASAQLQQSIIDCAIIDLRLPENDGGQPSAVHGNALFQQIFSLVPMPIVLFSGHLAEAAVDTWPNQVQKLAREDASVDRALDWLEKSDDLMEALDATRKQISKETARLFFSQIWGHWDETRRQKLDKTALHQVVARQVVSHIAEQLSFEGADLPPHQVNEFYFIPPLREAQLHTGDLVKHGDRVYVVLTPQCDIARGYPEDILVALCEATDTWNQIRDKLRESPEHKKTLERLADLGNQNVGISAHFLPPCGGAGPWLVNFKKYKTVSSAEAPALLQSRFASIAPQFIPNLVQRFSSYIGRVGQPAMAIESLASHVVR